MARHEMTVTERVRRAARAFRGEGVSATVPGVAQMIDGRPPEAAYEHVGKWVTWNNERVLTGFGDTPEEAFENEDADPLDILWFVHERGEHRL